MLTGVKVIQPLVLDEKRLGKLQRRINKMLEREVRAQCNGKFSHSYACQNMNIDPHVEDIIEQIKYQILWQQQAIEMGLL